MYGENKCQEILDYFFIDKKVLKDRGYLVSVVYNVETVSLFFTGISFQRHCKLSNHLGSRVWLRRN